MPHKLLDDYSNLDDNKDEIAIEVLKEYVDSEQDFIWTGRPVQGLRIQNYDWLLIPLSLLWGGFAILWEIEAIIMNAGILFQLWGIPFVLAGFYLIIGRFFHDNWLRSKTFYGLSKEFLIIKSDKTITLIQPKSLYNITIREDKDGRGSLYFENYSAPRRKYRSRQQMHIDSVKNVVNLYYTLRDLQQ